MSVVLISGGSGLIGSRLTSYLIGKGYTIIILSRDKSRKSPDPRIIYSYWNVEEGIIDVSSVIEANHIIHLAGAGVMDKKWTVEYRKEIIDSRIQSAQLIIRCIRENKHNIKSFITTSATGWYGDDSGRIAGKEKFDETDLPADDFLGETCVLWEATATAVTSCGVRLVKLRSGIVLSNEGGALTEFKRTLRFGVASILGNGRQVLSWIHIDDLCRMYGEAIENPYLNGTYNAVASVPVSQKKLVITLAEKWRNRFFIPLYIPAFLLKLVLGERSSEMLKSVTVSNKKIRDAGFTFLFPTIESALEDLKAGSSRT